MSLLLTSAGQRTTPSRLCVGSWRIQNHTSCIEGLETKYGFSPGFYQRLVQTKASENFTTCEEPLYAAYLAIQSGIPFLGGEADSEHIFSHMEKYGYPVNETIAFYLLRKTARWVEQGIVSKDNFESLAQDYLNRLPYYSENTIPMDQRLTISKFKEWYEQHNASPERGYLQMNSGHVAPLRTSNASYFERMSAETVHIRERHLDAQIANAIAKHDTVLVVYGGGHLVQSRNVFTQMFAHVENVKL